MPKAKGVAAAAESALVRKLSTIVVGQPEIWQDFEAAMSAIAIGYQPVEDVPVAGHGFAKPSQIADAEMTPDQRREAKAKLEEGYNHAMKALDKFELNMEKTILPSLRPTLEFTLGVMCFGCALGVFAWGVLKGSSIPLFGGGGGVAFSVGTVFSVFWKYHALKTQLLTAPSRLRTQFATCRTLQNYCDQADCMQKASASMEQWLRDIAMP